MNEKRNVKEEGEEEEEKKNLNSIFMIVNKVDSIASAICDYIVFFVAKRIHSLLRISLGFWLRKMKISNDDK